MPAPKPWAARKLVLSAAAVSALTACGVLLAVLRDIALGHYLGASASLDALFVGLSIPMFLGDTLGAATVGALVSLLARLNNSPESEAVRSYAAALAPFILAAITLLSVAAAVLAPLFLPLLAPGLSAPALADAVTVSRSLVLLPVCYASFHFLTAIHNYERRFGMPEFARLFLVGAVVVGLLFYGSRGPRFVASAYMWGAAAAPLVALLPLAVQSRLHPPASLATGVRVLRPFWNGLWPIALTSGIYFVGVLAAQWAASRVASGGIAVYRYGAAILAVPMSVVGQAISTVSLPWFADAHGSTGLDGALPRVRRSVVAAVLMTAFAAATTAAASRWLFALLYQHGAFSAEATRRCATMAHCISFGAAPASAAAVLQKAAMACSNRRTLLVPVGSAAASTLVLMLILPTLVGEQGLGLAWAAGQVVGTLSAGALLAPSQFAFAGDVARISALAAVSSGLAAVAGDSVGRMLPAAGTFCALIVAPLVAALVVVAALRVFLPRELGDVAAALRGAFRCQRS